MIYVSYYTKKTPYEDEVKKLENSFIKFQLPHIIYGLENTGSWEKNCQLKAQVIKNALEAYSTPIIYTDIDSQIVNNPVLFNHLDCDFAFFYNFPRNELLSGTLYFNNTNPAKKLINDWIVANKNNHKWDQINLYRTFIDNINNVRYAVLPHEYCFIFDNPYQKICKDPVIIHYQASRKYKGIINDK